MFRIFELEWTEEHSSLTLRNPRPKKLDNLNVIYSVKVLIVIFKCLGRLSKSLEDWGCYSVVEYLSSMYKVLGSIQSQVPVKKKKSASSAS